LFYRLLYKILSISIELWVLSHHQLFYSVVGIQLVNYF
jgi:hypothetical protein